MAFEKLLAFTKDVSDLPDKPTLTPAELKAQFDAAPDEVRVYLNNLIDALVKTTAGDSGAKNIGATTISGLTGNDLQTLLENLNTATAKKAQPAWTPVAFENGWINASGFTTAYRKLDTDKVEFKGCPAAGITAPGTVLFNLSVDCRPTETKTFSCLTTDFGGTPLTPSGITVNPNGNVTFYGGNAANRIFIDGIVFPLT